MRFGIVRFPGSNCDHDCYRAIRDGLGEDAVFVWHEDTLPGGVDVVVLPGGFSYGDALRAGAIARFSPVMRDVQRAAANGMPVIGICNGMQVLVEAGLLPGAMLPNAHGHFVCEDVWLRVESTRSPFTHNLDRDAVMRMPVAHGEGRWFVSEETLKEVERDGLIAFRYCGPDGTLDARYNPNGAVSHVAGLHNKAGNVLGLMPHPERACDALLGSTDGLSLFASVRGAGAVAR